MLPEKFAQLERVLQRNGGYVVMLSWFIFDTVHPIYISLLMPTSNLYLMYTCLLQIRWIAAEVYKREYTLVLDSVLDLTQHPISADDNVFNAAWNHRPFFCGARMTTCDLSFYSLASGIIQGDYCEGIVPDILHDCPRLRALVDRVAGHPRVREWNASLHV